MPTDPPLPSIVLLPLSGENQFSVEGLERQLVERAEP